MFGYSNLLFMNFLMKYLSNLYTSIGGKIIEILLDVDKHFLATFGFSMFQLEVMTGGCNFALLEYRNLTKVIGQGHWQGQGFWLTLVLSSRRSLNGN